MHDQYHNSTVQTEVNSLAAFQILSFKGLISDPDISLRGWGRWLFTLLLQFTHGHLSFPVVFLEEESQSGGLSAQQIIIEHLSGLSSQFLFVRQNRVIQTYMTRPSHRDGHARVSTPLLDYVDFLQSHNLWQSLCRETSLRKSLCFKKLTCVPAWKTTFRVVLL